MDSGGIMAVVSGIAPLAAVAALSLGLIGSAIGVVGSIATVAGIYWRWKIGKDREAAGRNEAALEAAEREAKRGRDRENIESEVRDLDPDALERVLDGEDGSG